MDLLDRADVANSVGDHALAETLSTQALSELHEPTLLRARALRALSMSLWRRGHTDQAVPYSQEAIGITKDASSAVDHTQSLLDLGMLQLFRHEHDAALSSLHAALDIAESHDDHKHAMRALGNIGSVYRHMHQPDRAIECYERALAWAERADDAQVRAGIHGNLGTTLSFMGRFHDALEHQQRSLALFEQLSLESSMAGTHVGVGYAHHCLGHIAQAMQHYERALEIFTRLGNPTGQALALRHKALSLKLIQETALAITVYEEAFNVYERLHDAEGMAGILVDLGSLCLDLQDNARAKAYYERAHTMFEASAHTRGIAIIHNNLCIVFKREGDLDTAEQHVRRSIELCEQARLTDQLNSARINLADLLTRRNSPDEAMALFNEVYTSSTELGATRLVVKALHGRSMIYLDPSYKDHSLAAAEETLQEALRTDALHDSDDTTMEIHQALAEVYKQREQWKACLDHTERAHDIAERIRSDRATHEAEMFEHRRALQNAERDRQVNLARYQEQERILHNILPTSIADRILSGSDMIADRYDNVTVFFSDIVGFTPLSTTISPDALVSALNDVFTSFDALAKRHGLEKIKTIGDAYMAVAGVPDPCDDHVHRTAMFALDVLASVSDLCQRTGLPLGIRIGVHTGPAVAGVIGIHKPVYDLWGDTVNIAARMESTGLPGQIHVSDVFAQELRRWHEAHNIDITSPTNELGMYLSSRGVIDVKGKGSMATWFLCASAVTTTPSHA